MNQEDDEPCQRPFYRELAAIVETLPAGKRERFIEWIVATAILLVEMVADDEADGE